MKTIKLTKGYVTLVDDEDFDWLSLFSWYAQEIQLRIYAATELQPTRKVLYMHRVILNAPACLLVDHKVGCGLNNQKDNLRFASKSQNAMNSSKSSNRSSRFKGVCWDKRSNKWKSYIAGSGLGYFLLEEDAARSYNKAAQKLFGEFAKLNEI